MPWPAQPALIAVFDRLGEIFLKHGAHLLGKILVINRLVRIQVPAQVPAINIARSDRYPGITETGLAVQDTWLEFENAHPAPEQRGIESSSGEAYRRMIGPQPRQQQTDVNAASRRPAQGATYPPRRNEIGSGEPHAPFGRAHMLQQIALDSLLRASAHERNAPKDRLPGRLQQRR